MLHCLSREASKFQFRWTHWSKIILKRITNILCAQLLLHSNKPSFINFWCFFIKITDWLSNIGKGLNRKCSWAHFIFSIELLPEHFTLFFSLLSNIPIFSTFCATHLQAFLISHNYWIIHQGRTGAAHAHACARVFFYIRAILYFA